MAYYAYSAFDADLTSVKHLIFEPDGPMLRLPANLLVTDQASVDLREKYRAHVQAVFQLLGSTPEAARTKAAAVLTIETALAQVALDRVSRRDPEKTYHPQTVADLKKLAPAFDWDRFFSGVGVSLTGANSTLNVSVPPFAEGFSKMLQAQSMDDIKAYLTWTLVHDSTPLLSQALQTERFNFFEKTLRGGG